MSATKGLKLINGIKTKRIPIGRQVSTTAIKEQTAPSIDVLPPTFNKCPFRNAIENVESLINNIPTKTSKDTSQIKSFDEIPGPRGLPIVGTLFDYMKKDGLQFSKMFEAYRQRSLQFGPIYKEKIATISTVVISDPEQYSKVMRAEGKCPVRREMEPMAHYRRTNNIGLGLVNAQGEEWYKHRTVVAKKLLKLKDVTDYIKPMTEVASDFTGRLNSIRDDNSEVQQLDKELFKWAMESIGTFLFEERIGCIANSPPQQAQAFIENLQGFFRLMQPLMYNLPLYKVLPTKLWKQYSEYADNVIGIGKQIIDKKAESLKSRAGTDDEERLPFLTYLLSNASFTSQEAVSTTVDLLSAAVETTTNATTWSLYCLAKNPEVQEKMYKEVTSVLQTGDEITKNTLSSLPYLKAVVKETFRVYPITYATSRIVQDDLEVAGYNIPAGTHVQANVYGMYKDPKLFEDPEVFKPERWLGNETDPKSRALLNLIWGHGARMCVGRRFAEQEIYILLSKIIQNFKLEHNHPDVEPTLNTVMTPDRPVLIKFIPRNPSS